MVRSSREPIAVIGAACRFPGNVANLDEFWELLCAGRDAVTTLPEDRFSLERFCSASKKLAGRSYTTAAGVIPKIKEFDSEFFGISRKEALDMDPQQRLALETAWEAFEYARIAPSSLKGSETGVFIGASNVDNSLRGPDDPSAFSPYSMIGSNLSIISNRLSYFFDFHGPSVTVDTACSSSIVAVHMACEALRSGRIPVAVVGGVNALMTPYPFVGFSRAQMLSPDGRCKVFDASGNGYVRSEGAGMVILKTLSEAKRDGNDILGLIAASGVNSDGRTTGLSLPNTQAQANLLRRIYSDFSLEKSKLVYVEAHGTGTAAGDPLEAAAIGEVLGMPLKNTRPLPVGSVKSNIGHLESAAGIAGLIKSLLVLRHCLIPANLHFKTPNPAIDFNGLNIQVPTKNLPLPKAGGGELISINSFGFGGTNAHLVLQKPDKGVAKKIPAARGKTLPPFFLSARSPESLAVLAGNYAARVKEASPALCYDLAASAVRTREEFPWRAIIQGRNVDELHENLQRFAKSPSSKNPALEQSASPKAGLGVFAFSGNGSQWCGMGKALLEADREFRTALEEVDGLISPHLGWRLLDIFTNPVAHEKDFDRTEKSQPALFAIQVALTKALAANGLHPSAVIGHSGGEVAAGWASGALSLADACVLIAARSALQAPMRGSGAMCVANTSPEKAALLLKDLGPDIEISAINTRSSLTFSGKEEVLRSFVQLCKSQRIAAKMLSISYPFHTKAMEDIREELHKALTGIDCRKPRIPFYSTVTGALLRSKPDAAYWFNNIRKPVLFARAFESAFADGYRLFMEIGPSPVLRSYARDILRNEPGESSVLPTLTGNEREAADFATAWKSAWQHGWKLDFSTHFPMRHANVGLPTYPWNREHLWPEDSREALGILRSPRIHPLLGWPLPGKAPIFENLLLPADFPWLADHVAGNGAVYPAAAFLESMLAAALHLYPDSRPCLERVAVSRPLPLTDSAPKATRILVDKEDGGLVFESRTHMSEEPWAPYARARIRPANGTPELTELPVDKPDSFGVPVDSATLYATAERYLLRYGPAFRSVKRIWFGQKRDTPEVLVEFSEPDPRSAAGMHIPPTLLDGALQSLFVMLEAQSQGAARAYLPVAFDSVILHSPGCPRFAHARLEKMSARSVLASFLLLNGNGQILLELRNCRFRRAQWLEQEKPESVPYAVTLTPRPHPGLRVPLEGVRMESLLAAARKQKEVEQNTRAHLLLQLAALSSAHETVLSLSVRPESGLNCRVAELVESGRLAPSQMQWFNAMLEHLEKAQLASRVKDRWQVAPVGSRPSATALWRTLLSSAPGFLPEATLLSHIFSTHGAILQGNFAESEDTILSTGLVTEYYASSQALKPSGRKAVACLAQLLRSTGNNQELNILHIGKSSASVISEALPLLDERLCRFVVAEEDAASAEAREAHFGIIPPLSFIALDPRSPGEEHVGRYHLLVLSWTLHKYLDSAAVLAACKDMLAPGGILCLLEQSPSAFTDYVFGSQPSWWAASADQELPVPLLQDSGYWREALLKAGFAAVEEPETDDGAFLLLARKNEELPAAAEALPNTAGDCAPQAEQHEQNHFVLVSGPENRSNATLAGRLAAALEQRHVRTELVHCLPARADDDAFWRDMLASWGKAAGKRTIQIIFLAGYDNRQDLPLAELADVQNAACAALTGLAKAWDATRPSMRLFVLGGGAFSDGMQDARPVPCQGALSGFTRVLRNEMPGLDPFFIDLHGGEKDWDALMPGLVHELLHPTEETEVVLSARMRCAPRMISLAGGTTSEGAGQDGSKLVFDNPGRLQNLYWSRMPLPVPAEGEVRITVKCVGLNFRDVMWSMGMLLDEALENGFSGPGMGIECSGVISAVGKGVKDLKVGDEVLCFTSSAFSSHVVTTADAVVKKPAAISFAEAATIPVAFMTAWYSLRHLAGMRPGERILIHGAAGGVGLAAIQIATHLGLEVFATAGAPEKQNFLRQLGVKHIFSSRSLDFAEQVMRRTNGEGVDAVLNSLAGEAIPAGLSVLRPFGRFLELGKRDFYADTPMRLRPFSNNLSYFGIDVDQLLIHQPLLARSLFTELMGLFDKRKLVPLPYTLYPASRTVDAFQTMQQSSHIGKLIVSMDGADKITRPRPAAQRHVSLRSNGTYLVTGGTGGLGLASAVRLAHRGAKNLILISRSGVKDEHSAALVEKMREDGVRVEILQADVANAAKMRKTLGKALQTLPPLRGLIHAAAVLDDGLISGQNTERINRVLAAKSLGAYVLHDLTKDLPLDFFVLYSSAATPFGNPGQSAYVAANCMLETLGAWRRSRGLPAQVIGWGAIDDTGMLTRNPKAREMLLKILGISPTPSRDALRWLEHCITCDVKDSYFFGLNWQSRADLPALATPRFSHLRRKSGSSREAAGPSLDKIRALPAKEGTALIASMLLEEIAHVLRMPKDRLPPSAPLSSLGMDSLMAVELSLAIEQKFEIIGFTMALSDKTTALTLAETLYKTVTGMEGREGADEEIQLIQSIEQKHGLTLSEQDRDSMAKNIKEGRHDSK